jgi:biotin carboxylase
MSTPEVRDDRPLLMVVTTGGRVFREYLLESIGAAYRVHLLLGAEPTWEARHIHSHTVLPDLLETVDAAAMVAAARALPEPLAGVLAWDEARVLQTAKIATELGLPGITPEAAMRCRDKHLTRLALDEAGVPQARSLLVGSPEEALRAALQIGYPVVLKPRAMAASLGVVRVDTPAELRARFAFARDTTLPGAWRYEQVLVEEYLTGPEISVDTAVHRGETLPMFVARKELGYPPYFEEVGHVVDASDPLLTDPQLRTIVQDTHDALGITDAMTHTELKLTPSGPRIIEVNGRLGGDLIPYLGLRATGVDPGLAAAAVACGRRPELVTDRKLVAAVRFFYPDLDDTVIRAVEWDESALPEAIAGVVPVAEPGQSVSPPPKGTLLGRVGYATAVAPTEQECRSALDAAQAAMVVRT